MIMFSVKPLSQQKRGVRIKALSLQNTERLPNSLRMQNNTG